MSMATTTEATIFDAAAADHEKDTTVAEVTEELEKVELTEEEKLAQKRAEIMARVAAARKAMAAEEHEKKKAGTPETISMDTHFGTHFSITCDGCCTSPIRGFRFKCRMCENHDLCEECYNEFEQGKLKHTNRQAKGMNRKVDEHSFYKFVEPKLFRPMNKAETKTRVRDPEKKKGKKGKKKR